MVYKIFKKNNYIVVIDDRNFFYEEHCSGVLVLKRLATDSTYDIVFVRPDNVPQAFYNVPFANIRDEFNAPYASVAAWETWYTTNTGCQGGANTAATLSAILATLQAQSEVEGVFVKDIGNSDKVVLQVRVWDQDSQTFISTLYFNPDGTPYTPVGPVEWVGTGGSVNSTIVGPLGETTTCDNAVAVTLCQALYDEVFLQGDDLANIFDALSNTGIIISTLPSITGDVNVLNFPVTQNVAITSPLGIQADCADAVSVALCQDEHDALLSIKNAVNGTLNVAVTSLPAISGTVELGATTLAALETVTVNQGTSPWVVSGTVALDAATLAALETINVIQSGSWTVALDAATLAALEDITVSGTVSATQSGAWTVALDVATLTALETVTVNQGTSPWNVAGSVSVTGEVEIINAVGSPIPVTIVAPVPVINVNLDAADDQVGIYGYVNGASGSPTPLNVDASGVVAIQDNGGSITVDANNLDIRDLSHLQDSIKVGDGVDFLEINTDGSINTNLRDGSGTPITSTGGALDVNILSGVTLDVNLSYTNDTVQVYGSDTTSPIATDSAGNLQIDVLTQPALTFATDTVDVTGSSVSVSNFPATQNVDIVNSITLDVSGSNVNAVVTATDLDIRDLVFASDKVDVSGSNVNATVTATDLDIRDLVFATDKVDVSGSSVTATVSGSVTVSATDLDIRDLTFASDSVNVSNSTNVGVVATDLDIRDLTFATDKVDVSNSTNVAVTDGGGSLTVDGTVAATQSGTWDITNITGTVSLPTGAATETTLGAVNTKLTPTTRTHNTISTSTSGSVSSGSLRGSVINVGSAAGTWNGISLPAGVAIPWDAVGPRDTYGAIAYDATGTTFIIEYTT